MILSITKEPSND